MTFMDQNSQLWSRSQLWFTLFAVLEDGKYEKCPPALSQSHEKTMRMGHIECAEPQNQNFDHFSSTHPVLRFFQRLFTYLTQ